jgi:hypothetical protein
MIPERAATAQCESQIKTPPRIQLLRHLHGLLSAAVPIPDYKELERIIYNYKVAHLKSQ